MMKVFAYRKCSTCMKALKWLEAHNVEFEERAIKEENPTYEELKEWYTMSGLPLKKFFNTSGMIYKQMNLKDKLKEMTEDDQLKLLATDGMLVKRPLVIGDNFVLTGFNLWMLFGKLSAADGQVRAFAATTKELVEAGKTYEEAVGGR